MEINRPLSETPLPQDRSSATAGAGRITIARLLWATGLIAFACFWLRFLASDHYYLGRWLFFALTCGAIGAIFGGHLGAWIGMGAFGVFLPLMCFSVYAAWQLSYASLVFLIAIGLRILSLYLSAVRYYGKAVPVEHKTCFREVPERAITGRCGTISPPPAADYNQTASPGSSERR